MTDAKRRQTKRQPKPGLLTVTEAQKQLGVSKAKIARMISAGALHAETDPLDARYKLVREEDVKRILEQSQLQASA